MKTIYLQRQGSTDTFNTLNAINTDLGYYIEVKAWSDNRYNIIIVSTRKQDDDTKIKRIEITAVYLSVADACRRVEKELREELSEDVNFHLYVQYLFDRQWAALKAYAGKRGVKIIGATSHYVTTELDAGPIIEQDVVRITHKDTISELVNKGKDLEKIVLSRAVQKHIERKILAYKNKTVIFS